MTDVLAASHRAAEPVRNLPQSVNPAEVVRLRMQVFAMSAENERLRNTVSYQLGAAILQAKSLRGLLALPSALFNVVLESRRRHGHGDGRRDGAHEAIQALLRQIIVESLDADAEQIIAVVEGEKASLQYRASVLTELSKIMRATDPDKALLLLRHAVKLDPSIARSATLAGMLVEGGAIDEPLNIYARLVARRATLSLGAQQKLALLEGMARVRDKGLAIPARPDRIASATDARSVLYMAASSSPYHTSGYTSRTQALVSAIAARDWTVSVATRAGYPHDRNDIHRMPPGPVQSVNGVDYTLLSGPKSNAVAFDTYCAAASQAVLRQIETVRPALVHAASNYMNATPALIAARRAGLPFVYEVRGLWELTHAAKDPRFEASERFAWQRQREAEVARNADLVVAISQGLKQELVERGVDESRIMIVPNCVDPAKFHPRRRDRALAREVMLGDSYVLGFVGSMTHYEGLIDLVTAVARLRAAGHDVCALLVGDGPAWQEIREAARSLDVLHHVIMPGRVPHDDVGRWYSLMDLATYPRLPSRVTELVPPLKPLEAMAMGLPVLASNVSAICDYVTHEETGLLFQRGDVDSLTATLEIAVSDRARMRRIARRARAAARERFTWDHAAETLTDAYRSLLSA